MALVVFLRAANVGGHQVFKPAAMAKELSAFDVVNIGAAGTFVVRNPKVTQTALRAELQRRLPFETDIMICPGTEVTRLVADDPLKQWADNKAFRRHITVLGKKPPQSTSVEMVASWPEDAEWQLKIVEIRNRFVLSVWRRKGQRLVYPNKVVEKLLTVGATTRTWDTIVKINKVLCGI